MSGWAYSFWIGLNDRDMHKHFYWSDGSPVRLTAWDGGYPKDYTSQSESLVITSDLSQKDGRGKKTENLVWQTWP